MKHSERLFREIERISEYIINNTDLPPTVVEHYYELCYTLLLKARTNDLTDLEEILSDLHLAFYYLLYGESNGFVYMRPV